MYKSVVRNINTIEKMLIDFLRVGICGGEINRETKENITEENLIKLYDFAQRHDVAHIVADVLFKQKHMPDHKIADVYKNCLMMSLVRYQQLIYELKRIEELFEENKIFHIPLKGAVIRNYYPEPWLRTSCDIDILVKKEQLDVAAELLTENLEYTVASKGSHDWGFYMHEKLHVELHFSLIETEADTDGLIHRNWNTDYLDNVWNTAIVVKGKQYEYNMTDEIFYLYHIAHMAKHFENGGCGIRPLLDLWILNNVVENKSETRQEFLNISGLQRFENVLCSLVDTWFNGAVYYELSQMVESYILTGGLYGNMENHIAMGQTRHGGKLKYIVQRFFPPYKSLKYHYPILEKHKFLYPICQVRRWYKLIFKGGIKRSVKEIKMNNSINNTHSKSVEFMMDELNL